MSVFTDPPAAPDAPGTAPLRTDRSTFAARADAAWAWLFSTFWPWLATFLSWLSTFASEIDAFVQSVNSSVGISARYTFSTTTADADPGAGSLRLNNAAQSSASQVMLDTADANGMDLSGLLPTFDDSTSSVKGKLRLQHASDLTKFLVLDVTAYAAPAGYAKLTVSGGVGSAASPFADGDPLVVSFVRNGDKGEQGPAWTGGAVAGRAYTTPNNLGAFSATPTFDASLSNVHTLPAMTANVTTVNITNPVDGQSISIRFVQDGTGGRTVTLPATIKATGTVDTGANRATLLFLTYYAGPARWEGGYMVVPA